MTRSLELRAAVLAACLASIGIPTHAAAQDQGLDLLSLIRREDSAGSDLHLSGIQLYRLPFAFHLRSLEKHPWGLRITLPVSLTSLRVENVSDIGAFVRKLGIAAIIPGVELELPVGRDTLVRPFGEVGLGRSDDSSLEVFYGAGVRMHTVRRGKQLRLTYGGAVSGRKVPERDSSYDRYAAFEAAADTQFPLGFSIGTKDVLAGVYIIGRAFNGLEYERDGQPPFILRGQTEVGLSFSTEPDLRIWKVPLRWLGVGYVFGRVSGVRMYTAFPF